MQWKRHHGGPGRISRPCNLASHTHTHSRIHARARTHTHRGYTCEHSVSHTYLQVSSTFWLNICSSWVGAGMSCADTVSALLQQHPQTHANKHTHMQCVCMCTHFELTLRSKASAGWVFNFKKRIIMKTIQTYELVEVLILSNVKTICRYAVALSNFYSDDAKKKRKRFWGINMRTPP